MLEDSKATRAELADIVTRHYGHTAQGSFFLKTMQDMPDGALEEYVVSQQADIAEVNAAIQMVVKHKASINRFTKDELALENLWSAVDTITKTAAVLKISAGEHRNVVALETSAAILDAVFHSQVDYLRAKRLVAGVTRLANSSYKKGD